MAQALPILLPIILSAATTAYSGISAHQQKVEAHKEAREQRAAWQAMSKPDPGALEAAATQNRGQLAQARLGSYQNLASNLAARGFGSGSGLAVGEAQNIERGYLQRIGQSATELTKFGLTPQFAPPGGAFGATGQIGAGGAMAGTGANLLGSAYGWTMMKNLLGNQTPTINLNYPYQNTTTNPYGISYDYGKPMSFQNFAY